MDYKVVPFKAGIRSSEGADQAAAQLEALANSYSADGWAYQGLETLETTVVTAATPGTSGCLGIGATPGTPESRSNATLYVAVFRKP